MNKHLYVLDDDLWTSLDKKVVAKTAAAMREAEVWELPYGDAPIWLRVHGPIFRKWFYNSDEPFSSYRHAEVRVDNLSTPPDDYGLVVKVLRFSEREETRKWIRDGLASTKGGGAYWTVDERAVHAENLRHNINKEGVVKAWTRNNWLIDQKSFEYQMDPVNEAERVKSFLADILVVVLACKGTKQEDKTRGPMKAGEPLQGDREIVTRVSLDVGPRVEHGGTHNSPIAHMREGHLHTFRTGAGRQGSIRKWVAPIFVNANAEFKSKRLSYEVEAPERKSNTVKISLDT